MKSLYITIAACLVMAALIPFSSSLAVCSADCGNVAIAPHFLYMFAHANILHWAINAWALLVLHNIFRWHRLLFAYILAVLLSFTSSTPHPPVLGASVITTFFFGFITPHFWNHNRTAALMMVALLVIGCFLPDIAALFHVIPYTLGIFFFFTEAAIRSFLAYCKP